MAVHQITCMNTGRSSDGTHEHITWLGLGTDAGYYERITVAQAIEQIRSPWGDRYFTVSPSTGLRANVVEGGCERCGQRPYVRTTSDGILDNNLSQVRLCRVA